MGPLPQFINSLAPLTSFLKTKKFSQLLILCDTNTHEKVFPLVQKELAGFVEPVVLYVEAGEASKSWEICLSLWEKMSQLNVDRKSLLINLGGGMITDLGAFVASVYKRGIPFVHLPTSLLGMTDAAIGGKCGIDFLNYKNQLGLFAKAEAIFIYPPFLETLAVEELKSGFAEVLKHALIKDFQYWEALKEIELNSWKEAASYIEQSVKIKSQIVQADPKEDGERKKLNFGHTVGHGIESFFLKKQKHLPHGYAIAAGMLIESWLSLHHTQLPVKDFEEITKSIQKQYEKVTYIEEDIAEIIEFIQQDKKSEKGESRFTLLSEIGKAELNIKVDNKQLYAALKHYLVLYEKT